MSDERVHGEVVGMDAAESAHAEAMNELAAYRKVLVELSEWLANHHDIDDVEAGQPPAPNWAMKVSDMLGILCDRHEVEL